MGRSMRTLPLERSAAERNNKSQYISVLHRVSLYSVVGQEATPSQKVGREYVKWQVKVCNWHGST
jgi:hypothetical protein